MHGTTFKLALSNWETWLVFTSESVTWKLVSKHEVEVRERFLASSPATTGRFRRQNVFRAETKSTIGGGVVSSIACSFVVSKSVTDIFCFPETVVVDCLHSE